MDPETPSRTSLGVAVARALHQMIDDAPRILEDPIAPLIVDTKSDDFAENYGAGGEPRAKRQRAIMVVRSRYAEDCLADAAARGARQYLILGAGLDTFAYRQPEWAHDLAIYEVDHPSSQSFKRSRLAAASIAPPANLTFVPVDFERRSLNEGLREVGFDFGAVTFCSWLGVTMYLTEEAIDATLRTLSRLPKGSEVVLTFIVPPDALPPADAEWLREIIARMATIGEPWLSLARPEAMTAKVRNLGFSDAIHFSPDEANARYCVGRRDGLAMASHLHLLRAVV